MNAPKDKMNELWERVNQEVSARGFTVYPGSIMTSGATAIWPFDRGIAEFLDLAKGLGRRIVYLESEEFGPDDIIDAMATLLSHVYDAFNADSPEALFDELGMSSEPKVREYLRYAQQHYGRRSRIVAEWVFEGVAHRFSKIAEWFGGFMDMSTSVADLIEATQPDKE